MQTNDSICQAWCYLQRKLTMLSVQQGAILQYKQANDAICQAVLSYKQSNDDFLSSFATIFFVAYTTSRSVDFFLFLEDEEIKMPHHDSK